MFIVNKFKSYITISLLNLYNKIKIILYKLLSYFTYLTQSFNVNIFKLFKHYCTNIKTVQ